MNKPYWQTLYVIWGNFLLFTLTLTTHFHWWMLPLAFLSMRLWGIMAEVATHRYFAHKSYQTDYICERCLLLFSFLVGQGATISWASVHRNHHYFDDKPGDPHSPLIYPWYQVLAGLIPRKQKKMLVSDMLRSPIKPYLTFENKYYWIMWSALWLVVGSLGLLPFFVLVSGSACWYLAISSVNILNHLETVGSKDHEGATSTNSEIMQRVTGAGYHNNHHRFPDQYDQGQGKFDLNGWIIRTFLSVDPREQ